MKTFVKIILVNLILLTLTQTAQGQSHYRRSFYGDFFAGLTMSSMDMERNNAYKKQRIGFQIGGNFNYRFYHALQFQTGFYLIKKGLVVERDTREKVSEGFYRVENYKNTVDANYVQIPLNLGFEFPISSANRLFFNFHAGVYGAYGFKGDTKKKGYTEHLFIEGDSERSENRANIDESRKTFENTGLKKWDYGLNANIAIVYDIFILQFQYDHGLADVASNAFKEDFKTTGKSVGKWRTRNYALSLGFRF